MQVRWLVWTSVLATLLSISGAQAEELPEAELAERREQARERYERGVQAYQEGRHKDAIELFLEADTLAPSSALSFNIARAYEMIKDSSNALRWYRDYLRREPDAEDREAVGKLIDHYEQVLEQKGLQQVSVLSEPEGATVRLDGRPVGVTPWTGDVPPGQHRVALSLRGYSDTERSFVLEANQSQDVSLRLVPATEAAPAPPAASPSAAAASAPQSSSTPADVGPAEPAGVGVLTYVVLGAGAATLAAAGGFEFARRSAEQDAEDASTQIEYADALDSMESHQTTARILAGIGGGLALAGGVLLVLDLTGVTGGSGTSSAFKSPTRLSAGAACSSADCWMSVRGRF